MPSKEPFTIKRPWGEFRQYTAGVPVAVKTILVKKGEALSLQYHKKRSEFWKILTGDPEVTIGEEKKPAKEGDEFFVPVEVQHRIEAPNGDVAFLEISYGDFDEEDIVRTKDNYGRV